MGGASEYCLTIRTPRGGADLRNTRFIFAEAISVVAPNDARRIMLHPGHRLVIGRHSDSRLSSLRSILDGESVLLAAARLLESALGEGGPDNVSIVVLEMGRR